jgi:NADH-ubiquinone oxidoreductase chain 5
MITLSILTSLVAGLGAVVECDIKKLVALSTLRHLGFISISIFSGALSLAFFHLFSHALFKSLLFMAVGGFIVVGLHSQDARFLSNSITYSPFSSFLILVSVMSLLGIPFVRGFYRKDYVLEILTYSPLSYLGVFLVFFNLILRCNYRVKIIYIAVGQPLGLSFIVVNPTTSNVPPMALLIMPILFSVFFGSLYIWTIVDTTFVYMVIVINKVTPIILVIFILCLYYLSTIYSLSFKLSVFIKSFIRTMAFTSRIIRLISLNVSTSLI